MNTLTDKEVIFLKNLLTLNLLDISERLERIAKDPNISKNKKEIQEIEILMQTMKSIYHKL